MAEDTIRVAVVDAVRQIKQEGLVVGTSGNVSGREPGATQFWITPSGVDYSTLSKDDLVCLDLEGRTRAGSLKPSSDALNHAAIYRARPDVGGIVHTHSTYATVFAVLRRPIPPLLIEAAGFLGGGVPVLEYLPAQTSGAPERLAMGLGPGRAALLPHHGVIAVGESVGSAVTAALLVEHAARVAYLAAQFGQPAVVPPADIDRMHHFLHEEYGQRR